MAVIEKVRFKKFWGDRDFDLDFERDVNFLIGVNGSGKTTAINIIAAALSGDFITLEKLPFTEVKINLYDPKTRRKPSITVSKEIKEGTNFSSISYIIKEKASDPGWSFSLEEPDEVRFYRQRTRYDPKRYARFLSAPVEIFERLSSIAPTSWLSVHRVGPDIQPAEDKNYESSIDIKLSQISENLVRYFSELDKSSANEDVKFQQYIFTSLLYERTQTTIFSKVKEMDIIKERDSLTEIFENLGVPEENVTKPIERHFNSLSSALKKQDEGGPFYMRDIYPLLNMWRIHDVVQKWDETRDRRTEIYRPRDTFIKVLNQIFQRKRMAINSRNEVIGISQSGKRLSVWDLSSGEKQMFILLGEALLQHDSPRIYIADEPELSLHVSWQESLVRNLLRINNKIQIIFATHSPDIVSGFESQVQDMEKIIP